MKIALMSGAYVNAGDFLIEERSRNLLEANIPNAHIDVMKRNESYDNRVDLLNSYDLIVFGGGPGFQRSLYQKHVPFVSELSRLKTPVTIMGWGCKAGSNSLSDLYQRNFFTSDMKRFVEYISGQSRLIACRDWYTVRMLRRQGITNTIMTGCPAWYRMDLIEKLAPRDGNFLENKEPGIILSDAAYPQNVKLMKTLLRTIMEIYPQAHIKILLHRGITKYNRWLVEEKNQILPYEVEDISRIPRGGMSAYDTCDFHIGFRVHAHIYNLSMGNPSILINEDVRGEGVNEALGIRNIYAGRYLREQICDYFDYLSATGLRQYVQACDAIKYYYTAMQKYIQEIKL